MILPLEVRTRVWYNPDMASAVFMIPGLIGLVLQLQATLLTSSAIVREREQGTMEQLIVTPIRPFEPVSYTHLAMPYGTLNVFGKQLDRLNGAQAVAWAPGGQSLVVLLPKGWAANADPEAWGEEPGEIRSWLPGQAPATVLVTQVDYASPIAWLAP